MDIKRLHKLLKLTLNYMEQQHWGYDDIAAMRAFVALCLKAARKGA